MDAPKAMAPSTTTTTIRFDLERPIGERWVILETNEQGLVVIRAAVHSQREAESKLAGLVPLGPRKP